MKKLETINDKDLEDLQKLKKAVTINLLTTIYSAPIFIFVYFNTPPHVTNMIFIVSILTGTLLSVLLFLKEAKGITPGIKGYLSMEAKFLVSELPSIIQIITVLAFLSFYLADTNSRAILSFIIIVLLYLYLKLRRNDYIKNNYPEIQAKISRPAIWNLHIVVSIFLASVVYFIAENLAHSQVR